MQTLSGGPVSGEDQAEVSLEIKTKRILRRSRDRNQMLWVTWQTLPATGWHCHYLWELLKITVSNDSIPMVEINLVTSGEVTKLSCCQRASINYFHLKTPSTGCEFDDWNKTFFLFGCFQAFCHVILLKKWETTVSVFTPPWTWWESGLLKLQTG